MIWDLLFCPVDSVIYGSNNGVVVKMWPMIAPAAGMIWQAVRARLRWM